MAVNLVTPKSNLIIGYRFQRLWVVQEFVLAQDVLILHGHEQVDLELLAPTARVLTGCRTQLLSDPNARANLDRDSPVWDLLSTAAKIWDLISFRESYGRSSRPSLLCCFRELSCGRSCTDDRDRIYAMLGIAGNHSVTPNYDLSPEDVLLNFATGCLLGGEVSLLHESSLGPRTFSNYSFVPCPFPRDNQPFSMENRNPRFRASGSSAFQAHSHRQGKVAIRGIQIGSITAFSGWIRREGGLKFTSDADHLGDEMTTMGYPDNFVEAWDAYKDWDTWSQSLYSSGQVHPRNRRASLADFERLISPETTGLARIAADRRSCGGVLKVALAVPSLLMRLHPSLSKSWERFKNSHSRSPRVIFSPPVINNRVLFWTCSGYMGLGNRYLKIGDRVVIFDGTQTPFVLRSASTSASEQEWTMVGDCYLDGWMDGNYAGHSIKDELSINAHGGLASGEAEASDQYTWKGIKAKLSQSPRPTLIREDLVLC
jgi:hypothetical protein